MNAAARIPHLMITPVGDTVSRVLVNVTTVLSARLVFAIETPFVGSALPTLYSASYVFPPYVFTSENATSASGLRPQIHSSWSLPRVALTLVVPAACSVAAPDSVKPV